MTTDDIAAMACIASLVALVLLGGSPSCIQPRIPCAHGVSVHYVQSIDHEE